MGLNTANVIRYSIPSDLEGNFIQLTPCSLICFFFLLLIIKGWIHNLTEEGVEPNPGPSDMEDIFNAVAKDFGVKHEASVRSDLEKIEQAIEAANPSIGK